MCVLRVAGTKLDVDGHLARLPFRACNIYRAGEPRSRLRPDGKRHERSGFTVDVSSAAPVLEDQINDALLFLALPEDALKRLRLDPQVEDMRLDFRVDL